MKNILLVEDDRWLSDLFVLVLKQHGFQTRTATTAAEAIDMIDSFWPGAIVLDFMLPGHSAPALLNELQSHDDTAKIPIILCTSIDAEQQYDNASLHAYGVETVVDKSTMKPETLIQALQKVGI